MNKFSPIESTTFEHEIDFGQVFAQIWAGKIWVALAMSLALAISAAGLMLTPPTYQADSLLQIEGNSGKLSLPDSLAGLSGEIPKSVAEIEIARSRLVLGQAVADLKLDWHATPRLAPFIGYALRNYALPFPDLEILRPYARAREQIRLDLLEIPPEWVGENIDVVATGAGGYVATLPNGRQIDGRVGELLSLEDRRFALRIGELVGEAGREFVVRHLSEPAAIQALRSRLTISERGRQSSIIEFKYTDNDRLRAQHILAAINRSYIDQNVARNAAEAESGLTFINSQLPEAKQATHQAEIALNDYRQSQQSIDLDLEAQSLLTQVTKLENQIVALNQQEDEIAQRYTRNHPVYQTLIKTRSVVEQQLTIARDELEKLPETQREIINLTRALEVAQKVFTQLLARQQELEMLRASSIGSVRLIDSARVAPAPIAPRKSLILALSLVLGGIIGAGFVLMRQWIRRGIQSADELEQIGLSVFATINRARVSQPSRRSQGVLPIHAISHPNDLVSEAFRSLRTSLHFGMLDAKTRSIAVTSAAPENGKSFVSVNLAAVAAQSGQRVCLIDTDLRRGYLRRYFGVEKNQPGLSEVISGEAKLEDVLVEGPVPGLMFLSTGRYPPNPSELLMRKEFAALINTLNDSFDLTICDTPPVLAVTDPVIIGNTVGTTIAVIEYDKTAVVEAQTMRRNLESAGVRLSGVILNSFNPRTARGTGGYTYQYTYKTR